MIKKYKKTNKFRFSIHGIMISSITSLITIVLLVFIIATMATGLFENVDSVAFRTLFNHAAGKEAGISTELNMTARSASMAANSLSNSYSTYLDSRAKNINELGTEKEILDNIFTQAVGEIRVFLENNAATGAFVMLNTYYNNKDNMAAIYLRDPTPGVGSQDSEDLTLLRGPTRLTNDYSYSLEKSWQYEQLLDSGSFRGYITMPQQAAIKYPKADKRDWGYWSSPFRLTKDDIEIVTFTVPLLDSHNNPIGVFGAEFSVKYLRQLLPTEGLPFDDGFYMISMMEDSNILINTALTANSKGEEFLNNYDQTVPLSLTKSTTGFTTFSTGLDKKMYASYSPLGIYGQSSPFKNNRYYLFAMAPKTRVLQNSYNILKGLAVALGVSFIVAIGGALVISKFIAGKIENLASEVSGINPELELVLTPTNVREIDTLADILKQMSLDIIKYSTRMSTIVDLVGIPMGAFEIQYDENRAYLTSSLIKLLDIPHKENESNYMDIDEFLNILPPLKLPDIENSHVQKDLPYGAQSDNNWIRIRLLKQNDNIYGTVIDITEEVHEKRMIEFERDYDPLTKLLNRHSYPSLMNAMIEKYKYKKGVLVFGDLDNLKYINDTFGHDIGDRYIREAACALKLFETDGAIVARVSGDEFVVFIHGKESCEELKIIVDETMLKIRNVEMILPDESIQKIRISVGLCYYPDDADNIDDLIKYADFAMYEIKHSVKGGTRDFDRRSYDKNSYIVRKPNQLDRLIEERRITFAFQPIVDVKTGNVFAYEALMRPQLREFHTPLEVLALAKSQSKLYQIEKLTTTCALEWLQENNIGMKDKKLFINLIANQLMMPDDEKELSVLFENISDNIVMEITESETGDDEILEKKVKYIRDIGCKIAIDDYGSGYNHEFSLIAISPDYVKIDMAIIRGVNTDINRQRIVKQVVEYATSNGIKVIAEGVETAEEMHMVIYLGVDYIQGYYLGKPNFELSMHEAERCQQAAEYYSSLKYSKV